MCRDTKCDRCHGTEEANFGMEGALPCRQSSAPLGWVTVKFHAAKQAHEATGDLGRRLWTMRRHLEVNTVHIVHLETGAAVEPGAGAGRVSVHDRVRVAE